MCDRRILDDERIVFTMLANEPAGGQRYGYMERQTFLKINFRATVVDWTIDVALRYRLSQETVYLATAVLDGYLQTVTTKVFSYNFQLLGIVCLLIASKIEDIKSLTVTNVVAVCAKTYERIDVVRTEGLVAHALNWNLHIPTAWNFLAWLVSCDGRTSADVGLLAQYIVELVIIEYGSLLWSPSHIACTALCIARQHGRVRPVLCRMAADMLACSLIDIRPCALIVFDMLACRNAKLTAVQRKYKDGVVVIDGTWDVLARHITKAWPPGDGDAGVLLQVLEWGLFSQTNLTAFEIWSGLKHACRNF